MSTPLTNPSTPPLNIFRNDDVLDLQGLPLYTININGRNAIFAKQLASVFGSKHDAGVILRQLIDSGVYSEGEGWLAISNKEILHLQKLEKTTSGKSTLENLLGPNSSSEEIIVFEEAAIWLLARSETVGGKEFTKFLVRTFLDIRDGHYVSADGSERIKARIQYTESENELKATAYKRGLKNFGYFVVEGDKAFYGNLTTEQVKERKGIPKDRALADFDSQIELTAKTLAKQATNVRIKQTDMKGQAMVFEYSANNKAMRQFLEQKGIKPEDTKKEEDIRLAYKEAKKQLKAKQGAGVKKIG